MFNRARDRLSDHNEPVVDGDDFALELTADRIAKVDVSALVG